MKLGYFFFLILLAVLLQLFQKIFNSIFKGHSDLSLQCPRGSFILPGMKMCHPWLTCLGIKENVTVMNNDLGKGAQKIVKEGIWLGHPVAVSILQHKEHEDDFQHNLKMLQLFSQELHVAQLVGWCMNDNSRSVIITELYPLGAADAIHSTIINNFPFLNTIYEKFKFCVHFVKIIDILHSHPGGPLVLCDANDPKKALSQFLVTNNLTLVLNDMDALPQVNRATGELIKCGRRELIGDFVAPEQLWPFDDLPFNDSAMPSYDEKVDIWKIPDVCNYIIGDKAGSSKLQLQLFNIHSQCKQLDPAKRPSAKQVLHVYNSISKKLKLEETNTKSDKLIRH
ncbi:protein O-mannose kinase-like [Physella acuta]|uniref:protein O-mannose kinase-like n=1 Tax=Physella acuta TaxID=109671 RepID=UPI0027DC5951|nr:protein O-mannose kinase-like [Physella acuta]XP_059143650.1 protein O-mannose kinase-like [Physella acuta]